MFLNDVGEQWKLVRWAQQVRHGTGGADLEVYILRDDK